LYTLESYIMFDDIEFCKKITIEDASSESDLDIVKADNTLLDAPWRQSFQKELKTIMTTQIYVANKQVKNFYEEVISKYYNGLNKLDINSIESDTLVLPIVWNFLYEKNKERKQAVTSTLLTDTALLTNNNIHPTKVSAAKDNTEHNLDTQEGIRKAIEDDIRCNDVTQPWPGAGQKTRTRGPKQRKQKKKKGKGPDVKEKQVEDQEQEKKQKLLKQFDIKRRTKKKMLLPSLKFDSIENYYRDVFMEVNVVGNTQQIPTKFNYLDGEKYIVGEDDYVLLHNHKIKLRKRKKKDLNFMIEDNEIKFETNKQLDVTQYLKKSGVFYFKEDNNTFNEYTQSTQRQKYDFLNIELNPEQTFAVDKIKDNMLIFHDPGVGKTINALAVAANFINNNKDKKYQIHIIAPSKLILEQWKNEFRFKLNENIRIRVYLTLQTHKAFDLVCKDGNTYDTFYNKCEETFPSMYTYDITNIIKNKMNEEQNEEDKRYKKMFDDIQLKWMKGLFSETTASGIEQLQQYDVSYYFFGPSFKKLLLDLNRKFTLNVTGNNNDIAGSIFATYFFDTNFYKSFFRSFWRNSIVFDSQGNIHIFASVAMRDDIEKQYKENNSELSIDMFRPFNYNEEKDIKDEIQEMTKKLKGTANYKPIKEYIKENKNSSHDRFDFGSIKEFVLKDKTDDFIEENKIEEDYKTFPLIGKQTIFIVDESHQLVSDNALKTQMRHLSDFSRSTKASIFCSATPVSSAEKPEKQLLHYGKLLNNISINYEIASEDNNITLFTALDLLQNKVTGKKKVSDSAKQKLKIFSILNRLENKTLGLSRLKQYLYRYLMNDFFRFFDSVSTVVASSKWKIDDNTQGFTDDTFQSKNTANTKTFTDENADYAKQQILFFKLQEIYKVDKTTSKFYPKFQMKEYMFGLKKYTNKNKRFGRIKQISNNDKNVTKATYKRQDQIDNSPWQDDTTHYCFHKQGKDNSNAQVINFEENEDQNTLKIFNKKGVINPFIFVPDLVVSKVRFMVEDALEKILTKSKNVMIYAFEKTQNDYHLEILKMYGVTFIDVKNTLTETLDLFLGKKENEQSFKRKVTRKRVSWLSDDKTESLKEEEIKEKEIEHMGNIVSNNVIKNTLEFMLRTTPELDNNKDKFWLEQLLGSDPTHVFVANILYGELSRDKRVVVQQLFNLGITDICLLSKAGAEGTDFKSTRESEMYVCSTDNRAVTADIIQFRGRLNRFKSHDVCPEQFRQVTYNRICLFNDIKLEDTVQQTKRMSRFFYYKVPRNNYKIFFHENHKKSANTSAPVMKICLFCYINPTKDPKSQTFKLDNDNKCKLCGATSSKSLYYLDPSSKSVTLGSENPNILTKINDDFVKYEGLLYRFQRDTLLELLLKTQSVEFLNFASRETQNNNERSIMVVNKENKFTFIKNISYKESSKKVTYVKSKPKAKRRAKPVAVNMTNEDTNTQGDTQEDETGTQGATQGDETGPMMNEEKNSDSDVEETKDEEQQPFKINAKVTLKKTIKIPINKDKKIIKISVKKGTTGTVIEYNNDGSPVVEFEITENNTKNEYKDSVDASALELNNDSSSEEEEGSEYEEDSSEEESSSEDADGEDDGEDESSEESSEDESSEEEEQVAKKKTAKKKKVASRKKKPAKLAKKK